MKHLLIFSLILISTPVFASCPIDGATNACIAQFQTVPVAKPMQTVIKRTDAVREFSSTPTTTAIDREPSDSRPLRTFGPTQQDYGYNSSCQFGICRNTGTPTNFTNSEN